MAKKQPTVYKQENGFGKPYKNHHSMNHPTVTIGCGATNVESSKMTAATCQSEIDVAEPQEYRKYYEYALEVDEQQDDKALEIKLCSFAKPHMMAFHCSWWGFFIAFFIWFAISPLLTEIRDDLKISDEDIWTSNIASVAGTIFMRILLGPACDKWGARIPMALVLTLCSIPTALVGFVNTATGLTIMRLFIGCAGSTFVTCQYWTSRMFAKEVVGTANALVAGWGNLGGGVTQLVVGAGLFPLFKVIFDGDVSKAWRAVSAVPAFLAIITGYMIYKISDDCPKGNYADLKREGSMQERSATSFFRQGVCNVNTWILFVQYACCFGTELTMNNFVAMYFKDQFELRTETAAAIASIFGWLNLFARGLGGYCSDKASAHCGMRGRLWVQTGCLIAEGALVLYFAQATSVNSAILVMTFFSFFVQAAEGSTYGIVPYVEPPSTGAIAGIVGAGGNTGAVCFSIAFRQLDYKKAFAIMGFATLTSAFMSVFILIKGHAGMFCGKDAHHQQSVTEELFTPYNIMGRKRGLVNIDDSESSSSSSSSSDEEDFQDHLDLPPSPSGGVGMGTNNVGMFSPIVEGNEEDDMDEEEHEEGEGSIDDNNKAGNVSGLKDETSTRTHKKAEED